MIMNERDSTSDPWFDDECRTVKRSVRLAERLACRCPSVENTADWQSRRRNYRALLRTKRDAFWRSQAEASYSRPRELWSTFDSILGRGRTAVSDAIGASTLHEFFDHKVDAIRDAISCRRSHLFRLIVIYRALGQLLPTTSSQLYDAYQINSARRIYCQHGCSSCVQQSSHHS